jgi:hypothetical protein
MKVIKLESKEKRRKMAGMAMIPADTRYQIPNTLNGDS